MATPVVASSSNTAFAGASAVTVTKPTGLAVGDVMIAFVGWFGGASRNLTIPAGWSNTQGINGFQGFWGLTKIADAADVAAANFTFTLSGVTTQIGGAIVRVTGTATGSEVADSEYNSTAVTDATSLSQTCSIAPISSESLVIIGFAPYDFDIPSIVTIASYASTPSLTFTEVLDFGFRDGSSDGMTIAIASAPKTNTTTITAYTATASQTVSAQQSVIYILNAPQNVSSDVSHFNISPEINSITVSQVNVNANVSNLDTIPVINGLEIADSSGDNIWTTIDKSTTIWTNLDKS